MKQKILIKFQKQPLRLRLPQHEVLPLRLVVLGGGDRKGGGGSGGHPSAAQEDLHRAGGSVGPELGGDKNKCFQFLWIFFLIFVIVVFVQPYNLKLKRRFSNFQF